MTNFTTLYYKDSNGNGQGLVLPTIQNLSLPDSTTISSRPTITGEYRNQYIATAAVKASMVVWLEAIDYGDSTLDVSDTLDKLVYLKTNRVPFNLITTQTEEESRFLSNLVIENISYSRSQDYRKRLVCTINCIQEKFTNLHWSLASAVDIFGHDIFTDPSTQVQTENDAFIAGSTETDFELSDNVVMATLKKLGDISGYTNMPVSRHIRSSVQSTVKLDGGSYVNTAYFKLTNPIDMSIMTSSSKIYNCGCQFTSKYDNDTSYTVDLGTWVVTLTKKDCSIEQNYPFSLGYPSSTKIESEVVAGVTNPLSLIAAANDASKIKQSKPTCSYPYDTADTYKDYAPTTSFEYIEPLSSLSTFLKGVKENGQITDDVAAVNTGSVVVKNDYVWSYKISNHYSFNVTYNSFSKSFTPTGGLDINSFKIPSSQLKITTSNEAKQSTWDGLNNGVWLVVVSLGAMVQLYLFSPTLFTNTRVNETGT